MRLQRVSAVRPGQRPDDWFRPASRDASSVVALASIVLAILGLLIVVVVFFIAEQAYWDSQVRKMCEKDGGVKILEKLRISKKESDLLPRAGENKLGVAFKEMAKPNTPAYAELSQTQIKSGNPSVVREEVVVKRRTDGAIVAKWIMYTRSGGDIPSYGHPTSFRCPETDKLMDDLQPLFIVEGSK